MSGINFMRSPCGCDGNSEDEVMQENPDAPVTSDAGTLEVQIKTPPSES